MKKTYITPSTTSIRLFAENDVAGNGISLISGGNDPTTTIANENEILSNKKENPVWGGSKNGMWDNMK